MGRKLLTVAIAIALLMFVLAPMASADIITTPTGVLIIPDGSTVTDIFSIKSGPVTIFGVDFSFPGGTGTTSGDFDDGDGTEINFTVPVTNLSVSLILDSDVADISFDVFPFHISLCSFPGPCPGTLDLTLTGPISNLELGTDQAFGGIDAMSFTAVDAGDPPTSSLILLGVGLIGLLGSSRRKLPLCP